MGEFPGHLHVVADLLESSLEGHYIYGVASPGVDARRLVGIMESLIPRHVLILSAVTTENEALSWTQKSH